jgi:hypothetical protein
MRILRNTLATLAVGAFLLVTAGSSFADVDARANVRVSKDVRIVEFIGIAKLVFIGAFVPVRAEKAAESLAVINQENEYNDACENCAEKKDLITDSVNNNDGITTVNQAGGNMNNQATAISVAFDAEEPPGDPDPQDDPAGFAESQAVVDQENHRNDVGSIQIIFRDALIEESINSNEGITAVNQATGNMNNQANIVSMAVSLEAGVALSEGLLGQDNHSNSNFEFDIFKTAKIIGSVHGNTGVTQVNQTSGNLANQANVASISLTLGGL